MPNRYTPPHQTNHSDMSAIIQTPPPKAPAPKASLPKAVTPRVRVSKRMLCSTLLLLGILIVTQSATKTSDAVEPNDSPAASSETVAPSENPQADDFQRQVGYCLGLDYGRRLKSDSIEIDFAGFVAGMRDALTDANPELTDEQIMAVMDRFQTELQQKVEGKMADIAAENLAKGQKFLAENRSKEGVMETPTGLQYKVIEAGDGDSPLGSDTVRCHYEGTLIDGTIFDSSYKRGEPAEFPVGGVIAGWTEALQQMEVGAKWEVYLPADIAYGARGAGGAIGPNETLIFTIELLDIK